MSAEAREVHSFQPGEVWGPNRAAVAVVAILATAVVVAMLILVFNARHESAAWTLHGIQRFTLTVAPIRDVLKPPYSRTKQLNKPAALFKSPSLVKMDEVPPQQLVVAPILPPLLGWRQQIEISSGSPARTDQRWTAFSPLQQALNAPRKPEAMQNGASYRSSDGSAMLKSYGICTELQNIQIGPSPSNRAMIALPGMNCAGDNQPTMAEELSKWANQEAKRYPPP